jgi:hypothetical protein
LPSAFSDPTLRCCSERRPRPRRLKSESPPARISRIDGPRFLPICHDKKIILHPGRARPEPRDSGRIGDCCILQSRNMRQGRPSQNGQPELVQGRPLRLCENLDSAVAEIANGATNPQGPRARLHEVAKANSLHAPGDEKSMTDHILTIRAALGNFNSFPISSSASTTEG